MNDLFNYKFITLVAYSLLGCGSMQFGFPNVLHHIPEDQNSCRRTVEKGNIYIYIYMYVCVCVYIYIYICHAHGRYKKCLQKFWSGDLQGRPRPTWEDNIKMNGRFWTGLI
jgi:hypothetical protein